ncbi:MAG: SH3 domain-containing protein [Chloroflexi bacterium]|nr:SH3 domain-containing protein [Chloroflexota bacterium]
MGSVVKATRFLLVLAVLLAGLNIVPALAQGPDATVIPDTLNMRAGPGEEFSVVAKLARNDALTLIGRDDLPGNGLWVLARTAQGAEGWVLSDYLTVREGLVLETLPVRGSGGAAAQPSGSGEAQSGSPAGGFPEGSGIPARTTDDVNFRSGPGTGYRVFRTLRAGTSALAKGRSGDGQWIFAGVGGQDGWLHASFVSLSTGTAGSLPVTNRVVEQVAPAADDAADTGGGASAPAPVAGGRGLTGFGYGGHVEHFSYPNLMHQAGMTWAKRQIRFSPGMPGAVAQGSIDQAHANGFKILLGIVGHPGDVLAPGYFDDYARFVGEVAALGPDAIEVWNEMNLDREWPAGHIDPGLYTQLLAKAYNAIKSANSSVAVISGAPAPTGAEGAFGTDRVWNDDRYVRGMAAAGAAQYMDCVGAHYNEGIVSPRQTSGDPRGNYYTRYFWGMVNTYANAFGGARPICFTELGYVTPEGLGPLPGGFDWGSGTSVAEQAQWLADAVRLSRSSGRVRLVIIWNVDFTAYGGDPMAGYAIVRPDGSCPACAALGRIG